jgi:hypothetical protein
MNKVKILTYIHDQDTRLVSHFQAIKNKALALQSHKVLLNPFLRTQTIVILTFLLEQLSHSWQVFSCPKVPENNTEL